jgi:hypothetical protein
MPYPKCKEFCASTGVRHEEAKLKDQGSGLLEFKGQGPEMVNVEELCWCVRPYTQRTFTSPGPWPLISQSVSQSVSQFQDFDVTSSVRPRSVKTHREVEKRVSRF